MLTQEQMDSQLEELLQKMLKIVKKEAIAKGPVVMLVEAIKELLLYIEEEHICDEYPLCNCIGCLKVKAVNIKLANVEQLMKEE